MQPFGKYGGNNFVPGLELIEADQPSNRFRLYLEHFALASPFKCGRGCFVTSSFFAERMKLPEGQYRALMRAGIKSQGCWAVPRTANSRYHRTAFKKNPALHMSC